VTTGGRRNSVRTTREWPNSSRRVLSGRRSGLNFANRTPGTASKPLAASTWVLDPPLKSSASPHGDHLLGPQFKKE